MIDDERPSNLSPSEGPADPSDGLPFFVEIWDAAGKSVDRTLARAASATLARAIFNSARGEHPERRVTLRRDARIQADSSE